MKMKYGVAILLALLLAPFAGIARAFAPGGRDAKNDGLGGSHEDGLVTRITEAAFTAPHLLCRKGTGDRQILVGTATARPLGVVTDAFAVTTNAGVQLLGTCGTVILTASGAITVDAPLYSAADGKVSATATAGCWLVGYALTAAADGGEFEAVTCVPTLVGVPVTVSATGGAVTALQAFQAVHVSNAGASGAATFTLPAAVVGMRVTANVEAAQELRLDPNGTETIALPSSGVQGAAGKYLTADAVGERVQLVCFTAGTWDVIDYSGTWTAEA